jgi:hypothetical protein
LSGQLSAIGTIVLAPMILVGLIVRRGLALGRRHGRVSASSAALWE